MTFISRFSFYIVAALILFVGISTTAVAQTVETFSPNDSVKAGDVIPFSITLKKDRTYDRIIYPDSAAFDDSFELRSRQRFSVTDFKDSLSYRLQFWGVKNDTIPSFAIQLIANGDTTTVYSRPVVIPFKTLLESDDAQLRPLKPIFEFFAAWWPWLLGLIILLAALLMYWFYFRGDEETESKPAAVFKPRPFLNPLKELENNLRQLQDVSLTNTEHFKQFYINLGDAIRLYFEQLYHIPALESTSREIIYELDRRAIDERLTEQTRIVLREADMVKFAKFTPTKEQAKEAYQKAKTFLAIAKELHSSRINQMKRQHLAHVEENRKAFNEKNEEEVQV